MTDPASILSEEALTAPRSPRELRTWVDEIHARLGETREGIVYARLGKGLTKPFFEEVRPLALLAERVFGTGDVICKPVLGNQSYDALIVDRRTTVPTTIKVEFTSAVDGYDNHLRMLVLNEKGHVSVYGEIKAEGSKHRGRKIEVEGIAVKHDSLRDNVIRLIGEALDRKTNKRYGASYWLCVVFDDQAFLRKPEDSEFIQQSVDALVRMRPLDVSRVCVLGMSGGYLSFHEITACAIQLVAPGVGDEQRPIGDDS